MTQKIKKCSSCGKLKSLDLFSAHKKGKFGKCAECKSCKSVRWNDWYRSNLDKRKNYKRIYYDNNSEKLRKYGRENHKRNIHRSKERWKKYSLENRDALRLYSCLSYLINREKILERASWKNLSEERKRSAIARHRKWVSENKEKAKGYRKTRRARKYSAPICDLTSDQWDLLKELFDFLCAYCGLKKPLTQDHVIPISKGGSHTFSNIVPACKSCNSRKKDKLNFEMTEVARLKFQSLSGI